MKGLSYTLIGNYEPLKPKSGRVTGRKKSPTATGVETEVEITPCHRTSRLLGRWESRSTVRVVARRDSRSLIRTSIPIFYPAVKTRQNSDVYTCDYSPRLQMTSQITHEPKDILNRVN